VPHDRGSAQNARSGVIVLAKKERSLSWCLKGVAAFLVGVLLGSAGRATAERCPRDMLDTGRVCIDRYEASLVDQATRQLLSPYYPPEFRLLGQVYATWELQRLNVGPESARNMPLPALSDFQRRGEYVPTAVSEKGSVPQAYLSYYSARRACENAGKRLCTDEEWVRACRGERNQPHPYGAEYRLGQCNVGSYQHPASVLHGLSSSGHLDPRLNLLVQENGERVLGRTGIRVGCRSAWGTDGAFDMVGNLDEWVESEPPKFRGGFYARGTTRGCDSEVKNHAPTYFDYSTGVRCCRAPRH
jgi:formylglycine-generating enzyme